jgi:hypothetical protein
VCTRLQSFVARRLNLSWGFVLQSKHNVSDKAGLLKLIRMCKEGIAVSELKDSYPGVAEDIEVSFEGCGSTNQRPFSPACFSAQLRPSRFACLVVQPFNFDLLIFHLRLCPTVQLRPANFAPSPSNPVQFRLCQLLKLSTHRTRATSRSFRGSLLCKVQIKDLRIRPQFWFDVYIKKVVFSVTVTVTDSTLRICMTLTSVLFHRRFETVAYFGCSLTMTHKTRSHTQTTQRL